MFSNQDPAQPKINKIIKKKKKNKTKNLAEITPLFKKYLYLWLHWVLVATCKLSLVAVSGGYSVLQSEWGLLTAVVSSRAQALGTQASAIAACWL